MPCRHAPLPQDVLAPIYECLARRGVVVTPTIVIYPAIVRMRLKTTEIPAAFRDQIRQIQTVVARLHAVGVPLLVGTDTSDYLEAMPIPPGVSFHEELALLEEAGLPPLDILAMATVNAAKTIGVDDRTGSIAPGKAADFVLLSDDPAKGVASLKAIKSVYRRGKAVR